MTASPTPFFAESAGALGQAEGHSATEHYAENASCSGMPSEEEIHAAMLEAQRVFRAERDAKLAEKGYWPDRSPAPLDVLARAILALFAPILAEKERVERNRDMWKGQCERQAGTLLDLRMQMLADEGQSRER